MNIAGLQYSLKERALEVYISGCKPPHCKGCHNPDLWSFEEGVEWECYKDEIREHLSSQMVDRIYIMGGEPLDQDIEELMSFLYFIFPWSLDKKIYLFTRYNIIPRRLFPLIDYYKVGEYQEGDEPYETSHGITLASRNQKIVDGYEVKYKEDF